MASVTLPRQDTETKQAFIVGTPDQRSRHMVTRRRMSRQRVPHALPCRTQAVLELLQSAVDFRVKATELPLALKDTT